MIVVKGTLLHVPSLVLLRGCARKLLFLRNEGLFEFFDLLLILDDLSLDLGDDILVGLRDVLSCCLAVDRVGFATIERGTRDLGATLHFRWQLSSL